MKVGRSFFFLVVSKSLAAAAATTAPVTQPTAPNLEVHEWAVFVIDGATGQLNPDGIVTATLPAFVTDKRYGSPSMPAAEPAPNPFAPRRIIRMGGAAPATAAPPPTGADMDQPSPVGVIRLIGSAEAKVDVGITAKGGTFVGSGPKAQERTNQLLWRDLTLSDQPPTPLSFTGPDNWFTQLRNVNSAYVSIEHTGCDRFLVYDLQMPYSSPLKISAGKDFSLEVSNTSAAPLHDLTFYQADRDLWRSATLSDLPASEHPAPAIAGSRLGATVIAVSSNRDRAKTLGYQGTRGVIVETVESNSPAAKVLQADDIIIRIDGKLVRSSDDLMSKLAAAPAEGTVKLRLLRNKTSADVEFAFTGKSPAASPSTTRALATTTTPATTRPTGPRSMHLTAAPATQPADLAAAWKPEMARAGVDPVDADVISRVIEQYAFDSHRLTAVYLLDDGEFDRLVQLEVVPQPAKIKRFGLVIVLNADPSKGSAIDDLIAQLGDDDWSRRDAAYHALSALGPAAAEKLRTASKSGDLEVVWRAERLLAQLPAK